MAKERILDNARFAPNVIDYHLTAMTLSLAVTVVGIPLILVARPLARWYWTRYYENLRVYLTSRDLKVQRGILTKEEKSIPLEKITDLAVFQGPVMRHYGLKGIRVETAGQSNQHGALVSVVGIVQIDTFRDLVLAQRDRITDRDEAPAVSAAPAAPVASAEHAGIAKADGAVLETLGDIRDTLRRIEEQLSKEHI